MIGIVLLLLANTGSPSMGADFAAMPKIYAEESYPFHALKIRDVVCFLARGNWYKLRDGRDYVCHRIVNETRVGKAKAFITKGDANPERDAGYVMMNNYEGKVQWRR